MQCSNRRDFLKGMGVATLGVFAASGLAGGLISCSSPQAEAPPANNTGSNSTPTGGSAIAVPWPYQKIDSQAAGERGYAGYSVGGCMYGGFVGVIGELAAKIGSPYDAFPIDMMKYGSAGVAGWGTLCGALNGAAAAICLVSDPKAYSSLITDLFNWYGITELPNFSPANPKIASIDTSVADSQLCHISVSKWCTKTGFHTTSPERADRCGRLTASVVKYAVDLLNKQADGAFQATFTNPDSVAGCLACHGKGSMFENVHISNQDTCTDCHTTFPSGHPAVIK
jgi:hypothetical protein